MAVWSNTFENCTDSTLEVGPVNFSKLSSLGSASAISTPERHIIMEDKELTAIMLAFSAMVHGRAIPTGRFAWFLAHVDKVTAAFLMAVMIIAIMTIVVSFAATATGTCGLRVFLLRRCSLAFGRGECN